MFFQQQVSTAKISPYLKTCNDNRKSIDVYLVHEMLSSQIFYLSYISVNRFSKSDTKAKHDIETAQNCFL